MTAPHADQLIDGYLARLRVAATDLPATVRDELVEDMRAHIAEARAREAEETDATILNILDRLGDPELLVAEARHRPTPALSSPAPAAPWLYRSGIIEIAAVILLPFLWVIGVILLWVSPAWNTRDKVIGSIFSLGGYPGLFIIMASFHQGFMVTTGSSCMTTDSSGNCAGPSTWEVIGTTLSVLRLVLILLLPVMTSAYLAIRLRWGRRPHVAATA